MKKRNSSYKLKGGPHKYSKEYQAWASATRGGNPKEIAAAARDHSFRFPPLACTFDAASKIHQTNMRYWQNRD